ncbi:MAG: exodeoxyribonuclease VII small subunit [Aggregatilineales bacterium]
MDDLQDMSFEQAYDALDEVIAKLESGEMTLEDSLTLYERGRELSAYCQGILENAQLRIQRLNDDGVLHEHTDD